MTQTHKQTAVKDIIVDMVQHVQALLTAPPSTDVDRASALLELEKSLRAEWGGDRPYIATRRGDVSAQLHSERNSRILRAYQAGRHIAWIAKKENLSERRVFQLVGTLKAARRPTGQG